MFEPFSFEFPWFLTLILPFVLSSIYNKKETPSYYIPHLHQLISSKKKKRPLKAFLKWIMIIFSLIALSSPIITKGLINQDKDGIDIVLSLDTSGSMSLTGFNEENYTQNRWEVVRDVVLSFITERKKDRIGLVIFGNTSSVASPLSYDNEAPLNIIKQISIGIVGKSTALVDSIVTSISLLKKSQSPSKIIILLSDGEDTSSKVPLSIALKFANKHQIKIYTISIGESNNNMLKIISQESGAKSFVANNKEDLFEVYESINTLEAQNEDKKIKVIRYLYTYFLGLSLISALFLALLVRKSEAI